MTGPLDPGAPITNGGRDWNFFTKFSPTVSTFNTDADVIITIPTYTVTFFLEGSTGNQVQYSFNGYTVHGDMTFGQSSAALTFDNRVISKIWFKVLSGTPTIRIEAWAIR